MENERVKARKEFFFGKLILKDQCFYSYIYNDNKNIYKFIKKTVNEKKKKCLSLYTPTKKTHLYMLDSVQNSKVLATAKQLIRKNSVCCLKNQAIYSTEPT